MFVKLFLCMTKAVIVYKCTLINIISGTKHLETAVPGYTVFDIPESVTSRKIQDASLWIYIKPHGSDISTKTIYEVYVYIVDKKAKQEDFLKGQVKYHKAVNSGWVEVKFSHIAHHWVKRPEANRGVVIQAFDVDGNSVAVTPDNAKDESYVSKMYNQRNQLGFI